MPMSESVEQKAMRLVRKYIQEHLDKGDKQEWYLDAYKKFENCCISEL